MHADTADALTFPLLALASSAVALMLDHHQQTADTPATSWEPDGVIIEYGLITGMCLLAGTVRARLASTTPHETERAFVLATLIGYAPIAVWQCARSYQRQRELATTWRTLYHEEHQIGTPRKRTR